VRLVVVGDPLAHDDLGIVDGLGDGEDVEATRSQIAHVVEIKHLAVDGKRRVHGALLDSRESGDHSRRVDSECAALIPSQRSEINPRLIGAKECVVSGRLLNIGRADDIHCVVPVGCTAGATKRSEILHFAILINKGVKRTVGGQG
jgi:hypothetical protein